MRKGTANRTKKRARQMAGEKLLALSEDMASQAKKSLNINQSELHKASPAKLDKIRKLRRQLEEDPNEGERESDLAIFRNSDAAQDEFEGTGDSSMHDGDDSDVDSLLGPSKAVKNDGEVTSNNSAIESDDDGANNDGENECNRSDAAISEEPVEEIVVVSSPVDTKFKAAAKAASEKASAAEAEAAAAAEVEAAAAAEAEAAAAAEVEAAAAAAEAEAAAAAEAEAAAAAEVEAAAAAEAEAAAAAEVEAAAAAEVEAAEAAAAAEAKAAEKAASEVEAAEAEEVCLVTTAYLLSDAAYDPTAWRTSDAPPVLTDWDLQIHLHWLRQPKVNDTIAIRLEVNGWIWGKITKLTTKVVWIESGRCVIPDHLLKVRRVALAPSEYVENWYLYEPLAVWKQKTAARAKYANQYSDAAVAAEEAAAAFKVEKTAAEKSLSALITTQPLAGRAFDSQESLSQESASKPKTLGLKRSNINKRGTNKLVDAKSSPSRTSGRKKTKTK
jgi:hypothetical protein